LGTNPSQGAIGGQSIQQGARRRQVVNCFRNKRPSNGGAVLRRSTWKASAGSNEFLDAYDFQGGDQGLLFSVNVPSSSASQENNELWMLSHVCDKVSLNLFILLIFIGF